MKPRFVGLEKEWQWGQLIEHVPILRVEDTEGIFAYDEDSGELLAAMAFDNWTNNGVQAHILVRRPMVLRHGFLSLCFNYVFKHRKKKVMYALIASNNEKSLNLCKHMGAHEKCRFEEAFADGVDYVVMEMREAECKYLENK